VSSEGYSYDPEFTPDGKTLCYRVLKGALPWVDPTELRIVNLNSSRDEPLLPGLAISGRMDAGYDISPDGKEVVVSALDEQGRRGLWLASLDRRSPPRQITSLEGQQPKFGPGGKVFFLAFEVGSPFVYEVREDGTGLRKVLDQPIARLVGVSRDGRWLLVKRPRKEGPNYAALSLVNGSSIPILSSESEVDLRWSPDGRLFFISLPTAALAGSGHTYVVPLPNGQTFPRIPPGGFASEREIARLPGARLINAYDTSVGQSSDLYAFARETVQRNLFRVPLP
jgi:Tol biopolymer transport system component